MSYIVNSNYTAEQVKFLESRKEFINFLFGDGVLPDSLLLIQQGKGSFEGCVGTLEMLHQQKAEYAWFVDHDLHEFKLNCYIASRLKYIRTKYMKEEGLMWEGQYFYALLSEYEPIIQWMIEQPISASMQKRINNPAQNQYRYYQMTLALQGNWSEIKKRAEVFLSDPPSKMKKYIPDQRFYLALANADKAGMEVALAELTHPKLALKHNGNFDFAFSGNFIGCFATLYAKIAQRYGFILDISTPYIPAEWIPIAPLSEYLDPYDFMQKYNIVS